MSLAQGIGQGSGTSILTNIVPFDMVDALVRRIYRDIAINGLSKQEDWPARHAAVNHLCTCEEVMDIVDLLERCVPADIGYVCLPNQLIFHPPDDVPDDYAITEHIDVPPRGQIYTLIAGVPLTDWTGRNGSPHIFHNQLHEPLVVQRGSILFMGPQCPHSPGINRDPMPRLGLYVRWAIDKTHLNPSDGFDEGTV